jgi:hypothetical protein
MATHQGTIGQVQLVECKFDYATPDLVTGATVYTPYVGDWLIDGWIAVNVAFNGTTPLADFGLFGASKPGFLNTLGTAASIVALQDMTTVAAVNTLGLLANAGNYNDAQGLSIYNATMTPLPAQFASDDPIQVLVNQTGLPAGPDSVNTAGEASLFLRIASMTGQGTG